MVGALSLVAPRSSLVVNAADFLADVPLFDDLEAADRRDIAATMSVVDFPDERIVFDEGTEGDAAYFVVEGTVHLESSGVVLAVRAEGEMVGEYALIDNSPRSAAARALANTRLLRWPRETFNRCLVEQPAVGTGLFRLLTQKLREDVDKRVADALERQRWKLELEWARDVQRGLLPDEDATIGGMELSCACHPAGHVGGDLYDYLTSPRRSGVVADEAVGVLIGDVTGHGVYSALLAAMAKSCLYNQHRTDPSPGAVMRALARTVELSVGTRLLMSAAYAHVSADEVVFANAGHPPILHVNQGDGTVTRLGALDPILGALDAPNYLGLEQRRALRRGDLLVFVTDGVTETRSAAGDLFGAGRLDAVLARDSYASAQSCRDAVLRAVRDFRGNAPVEDDLTLVVIRIR